MSNSSSLRSTDIPHLPEILVHIGFMLTPPDLLSCVQVCRLWNDIFVLPLYHTLDDSKYSWPIIMSEYDSEDAVGKKDEEWIRKVFDKHGHLVRHFSVSWTLLIDCAFDTGTFTQLHSISTSFIGVRQSRRKQIEFQHRMSLVNDGHGLPFVSGCAEVARRVLLSPLFTDALTPKSAGRSTVREQEQNWETIQKLLLLVTHNPGLKRLQLDQSLKNLAGIKDISCIYQILRTLPELATFESDFLAVDFGRVLDFAPKLHTCNFAVTINSSNFLLTTPYLQLQSLNVDSYMESRTFFTLLNNLPRLGRLSFHGFSNRSEFCVVSPRILNNIPSRLRVLRFHHQTNTKDQHIADHVLPWLPHLTEFRINILTTTIAWALVHHCPMLEIFEATNGESLHEEYINRPLLEMGTASILFSGCPRLKVFDGIHHEIDAEKMITLPIVCEELVVFRCQIRGVPRLTSTEQRSIRTQETGSSTLKDEQEAEEAAQRDYDYGSPFADTLELSLDFGLDRLGVLTDLEVFGFESLDHRIGRVGKLKAAVGIAPPHPVIIYPPIFHAFNSFLNNSLMMPEILQAIAIHLDPPDLLTCIQVCNLWHKTLLPALWHTIDDRKYAWPTILSLYDSEDSLGEQDETWLRDIFSKHGYLIRHLIVTWKILVDISSDSSSCCNNVQVLSTFDVSDNITEEEEREQRWYSNQIMGQTATRYRPGNPTAQTGKTLLPLFEGMLAPLKANDRTPDQQKRDLETVQRFWMLVRQNLGLRSLRLDGGLNRLCVIKDPQFIYEILGPLLQFCELENNVVVLDRQRLLDLLPGLQTYRTNFSE
ncbi:hypothetical protein KI688_002307 [Linnemannia hyalina]|uniref:F-box domain-containing protein n=1 Tax=Linnemannia hyalina TaxID=64524 RepID=A0A9P8BR84_9FUNG|nr:hypothetical protein KI688_002307 [Linnemannia hyalina]